MVSKMKKYLTIALLIILGTVGVNAQTVSSATIKTSIAKILEENYSKKINADVEVKVIGTPFTELVLPNGDITYKIVNNNDKILPRDIKRIDVFVNNAYIKTLNLPTQTSIYKHVLVAKDTITREQSISQENVEVKRVDVSMKVDYVLSQEVLGKEMSANKMFQKGEIIDKRFIKLRPDVARNSDVRIFFVSNNSVMISIDGTAMADGMTGDYINVENKNYKKVYNGKIIGENKVLVNI